LLGSSKIVKKGQVVEVDAFGQKLAVFRGENGEVGVLDVYCRLILLDVLSV